MIQIAALRSRLEKQPTDLRPYASYIRDDALGNLLSGVRLPEASTDASIVVAPDFHPKTASRFTL
jgi:hypothetical protein